MNLYLISRKSTSIGMPCYIPPPPLPKKNLNLPLLQLNSWDSWEVHKTYTYRMSNGDHSLTVHGPRQVYYGVISFVLIDHDLDKSPGVIGSVKDHGITWNSISSIVYSILTIETVRPVQLLTTDKFVDRASDWKMEYCADNYQLILNQAYLVKIQTQHIYCWESRKLCWYLWLCLAFLVQIYREWFAAMETWQIEWLATIIVHELRYLFGNTLSVLFDKYFNLPVKQYFIMYKHNRTGQ